MTMSPATALAALLGAGIGIGVWLVLAGLRPPPAGAASGRWSRWVARVQSAPGGDRRGFRLAGAGVAGLLAGVATGWVVAVFAVAALVWAAPRMFGGNADHDAAVARIEAVATWTEMLRDTLSAAAGIEQAILATADLAPEAIRGDVAALSARLEDGAALPPALRTFAREVDDPTCDLVVAALVLAAEQQARQLAELLGQLATAARAQVAMRLRVEAGRARTRTGVRVIVGTTSLFAVGLVVLNRDYLAAYDTVEGQVVLAAVVALFALGFGWLDRMSRVATAGRVLAGAGQASVAEEVSVR